MVVVREAAGDDWPSIWRIIEPIIRAGETYALDQDMDEEAARSLRFEIVGTVPQAFDHPTEGYVGLHVMYLAL